MTRLTACILTTVLAVLAALGAWAVGSGDVADALPPGDRVRTAAESLRESNVYVAPESADLLGEDDRIRLAAAAAAARPEVFVLVWESTTEGGFYLDTEGLRQVGALLGRPGLYVSIDPDYVASQDVGIDGGYVSAGSFGEGVNVTASAVAAKISEIISENDGREYSEASTTGSRYWGGTWGTIGAGLLFGVLGGLGLAAVVVIVWFIVRARLRSPS
jgi:hypothetical protein